MVGLAFIKRVLGPLDEGAALGAQLQVISLGPGVLLGDGAAAATPEASAHALFALLQQYTRYSFAPLVKALATTDAAAAATAAAGNDGDGNEGEESVVGKQHQHGAAAAASLSGVSSASLRALQKKITELELALAQVH